MQREGLLPDVVTFLSILKACGSSRPLDKGQKIHGKINVVTYLCCLKTCGRVGDIEKV